jgi:hypothetical protein
MLIKSNILLDVRYVNIKIDSVDNFKYLGLILDKDLTFSLHIKRLKGRISRIVGLLYILLIICGIEYNLFITDFELLILLLYMVIFVKLVHTNLFSISNILSIEL